MSKKVGKGVDWYDEIYNFMKRNPNQKIHWETIETHLLNLTIGSRFLRPDVVRRYSSMMTEPKHKLIRNKYPAMLKVGDGYYKYFPELEPKKATLAAFFDEPVKITITQTQIELSS